MTATQIIPYVPREIEDFSQRVIGNERQTLIDAAAFIRNRQEELKGLVGRIIGVVLEQGSALQVAHDLCKKNKIVWEQWVLEFTHFKDVGSADNRRNLWLNLRAPLLASPLEAQERMNLGALYKLAVEGVTDEMWQNFNNALIQNPELKGDIKLATIAKNQRVYDRFETRELNLEQAYGLARALPSCTEYVQNIVHQHGVKYAAVATWLNGAFLDYCNTPDSERPDKTWADIQAYDFALVWVQRGKDYSVPVADANEDTIRLYMQYRWSMKWGDGVTKQRATANILRQDGKILLEVDQLVFPEGFSDGKILIDLLFEE